MADIVLWPSQVLPPQSTPFNPRPFSRSGGRSLGGISRSTKTDRGFWVGSLDGIVFRRATQFAQTRTWNAIREALGGTVGLLAVPVCASRVWAAPGFTSFAAEPLPHDDGALFSDGSGYGQGVINIEMAAAAALGATVVSLRLIHAPTASGVRFSYGHAMYETGRIISQLSDDEFQVENFPAIRAPIPAGAPLEADRPTVLCHLASDDAMDLQFPASGMPRPSIQLVEAVDYWNDLALGLV